MLWSFSFSLSAFLSARPESSHPGRFGWTIIKLKLFFWQRALGKEL
jgi:hypothetical protein